MQSLAEKPEKGKGSAEKAEYRDNLERELNIFA